MINDVARYNLRSCFLQVKLPFCSAHCDWIDVDDVPSGDGDSRCGVRRCSRRLDTVTRYTDVLASVESFACVETSACCVRGNNSLEKGIGYVVIHAELIAIDVYLRSPVVS